MMLGTLPVALYATFVLPFSILASLIHTGTWYCKLISIFVGAYLNAHSKYLPYILFYTYDKNCKDCKECLGNTIGSTYIVHM